MFDKKEKETNCNFLRYYKFYLLSSRLVSFYFDFDMSSFVCGYFQFCNKLNKTTLNVNS